MHVVLRHGYGMLMISRSMRVYLSDRNSRRKQ